MARALTCFVSACDEPQSTDVSHRVRMWWPVNLVNADQDGLNVHVDRKVFQDPLVRAEHKVHTGCSRAATLGWVPQVAAQLGLVACREVVVSVRIYWH